MNKLSANERYLMEKKKKTQKIILWCVGIAIVLFIAILVMLDENSPRNQFLSKAFVSEASIAEFYVDDQVIPNKSYVRLSLINSGNNTASLTMDESWVEVTNEFFGKHRVRDIVGVLVGNYDVYKENFFGLAKGSGQTFEKNVWGIENIFDTLDMANEAYPQKLFNANAQLKKKATAKDKYFFVFTYEEREMTVEVSSEQFNKYKENDTVECTFEGLGEFVKITKLV